MFEITLPPPLIMSTLLTCIITDFLQLLSKVAECILPDSALRGKACHCPHTHLYPSEKLFAPHVPHPLVGQGLLLGSATILQLWGWQDTPSYLHK